MKRVFVTVAFAGVALSLTGCAPKPLLAHEALTKLTEAGIECVLPSEQGSLSCKDSKGNDYNVIIYGGGAAQMAQDLEGMCSSTNTKYDEWAEGLNWRAQQLASALGGSVKTRTADCK